MLKHSQASAASGGAADAFCLWWREELRESQNELSWKGPTGTESSSCPVLAVDTEAFSECCSIHSMIGFSGADGVHSEAGLGGLFQP